jgi:enoyl-CoA hydratase/carnithine racemase
LPAESSLVMKTSEPNVVMRVQALLDLPIAASMATHGDGILNAARRHPETATVLLDTLSTTAKLPDAIALTVESLAYGLLQGGADYARWLAIQAPTKSLAADGAVRLDRADNVLSICMDRPTALNAINSNMRDQLYDAFIIAALDHEITRVELAATGRAFSVGGDLTEFGTTRDPATAHCIRAQTLPARALIGCRERLHVHVQGACVGAGLEMAAFAKWLTASPRAWFQLPELTMGLIPGAGGCVSVPQRMGWEMAALFILSGKRINAQTALSWGLIDAIVDGRTGGGWMPEQL